MPARSQANSRSSAVGTDLARLAAGEEVDRPGRVGRAARARNSASAPRAWRWWRWWRRVRRRARRTLHGAARRSAPATRRRSSRRGLAGCSRLDLRHRVSRSSPYSVVEGAGLQALLCCSQRTITAIVAVRDDHALGAGGARWRAAGRASRHGRDSTKPRSTRAPPARAAQLHPAAGEGIAVVAEARDPDRVLRRRRRDDQRAAAKARLVATSLDHHASAGSVDAGVAVGAVQRLDRAVHDDRADGRIEPARMRCALPKAVAEQHAGATRRGIARHQASMSANSSRCGCQR